MMDADEQACEAMELVRAVCPLFEGRSPQVQGAALADLLATWLAGHVKLGDPQATKVVRETMLALHIKAVRGLIDVNYEGYVEPQLKRRTQ
jgi:hypothetical protein